MVEQKLSVPKYWRNIPKYYRLEGVMCKKCGKLYYPPRIVCTCGSREFEKISLINNAHRFTLSNYTVLYQVPIEYEKSKPIIIGLINIDGKLNILSQLTDIIDPSKIEIGKDVEPVFRVVKKDGIFGIICYGYKFRLKE